MVNIQVDSNGEMRCASCGGKHFIEKRTGRAKVIGVGLGVATLGVAGAAAPLLAKKKLQCKLCGTYNDMGNAEPFPEKKEQPSTREGQFLEIKKPRRPGQQSD